MRDNNLARGGEGETRNAKIMSIMAVYKGIGGLDDFFSLCLTEISARGRYLSRGTTVLRECTTRKHPLRRTGRCSATAAEISFDISTSFRSAHRRVSLHRRRRCHRRRRSPTTGRHRITASCSTHGAAEIVSRTGTIYLLLPILSLLYL